MKHDMTTGHDADDKYCICHDCLRKAGILEAAPSPASLDLEATSKVFDHLEKTIVHRGAMGQMIPCCGPHAELSKARIEVSELLEEVRRLREGDKTTTALLEDAIREIDRLRVERESPKALVWTKEDPKGPGWYCFYHPNWRRAENMKFDVIEVYVHGSIHHGKGFIWAGPIPEPPPTPNTNGAAE